MTPEQLFTIANTSVLPGWALLIFLPRWRWTARFVAPVLIPTLLALLYVYLIAGNLFGSEGGFRTLEGVAQLFRSPPLLLAGWVHYLAFDLFIGAWEVRDAQANGIPHLLVIPCLLGTFMLGPAGLLLYLILRATMRRRLQIDEQAA
ncbi:membrane protein [Acidobacteria bacterium Mor1]|nr:membrane protein [Acidobacteria bacterium Mor1]